MAEEQEYEERETHRVDGRYLDTHIEGIAIQFQRGRFVDKHGAFTNLEYFVRKFYPELANHDVDNLDIFYRSKEAALRWAERFGPVFIMRMLNGENPYAHFMTQDDVFRKRIWCARLGAGGDPVFATTCKGAIVLAVIQAFRDMHHTISAPTGPVLVKH